MCHSVKNMVSSYCFFKASPGEVCKACPDLFPRVECRPDSAGLAEISRRFTKWEEYNPHTIFSHPAANWYN